MKDMASLKDTSSAAFNSAASSYDESFTYSWTGRMQRERVWRYLEKNIHLHDHPAILELNCGTGEDACRLAAKGHHVEATDISERMLKVASQKKEILDIGNLHFHLCDMRALNQLFSGQQFSLIFSNFGGLNCLSPDEITQLGNDLDPLLEKNGSLLLVVMGRKCLWELLYFTFKGRKDQAMRRRTIDPVSVRIGSSIQQVWYYSPKELSNLLKNKFIPVKTKPVGLLIPPSYLEKGMQGRNGWKNILYRLEKFFSNSSFLSNYADHYLIELKKR